MPPVVVGIVAGLTAYGLGASIGASLLIGFSVFQRRRAQEQQRRGTRQRARQTVRAEVEPANWRIGTTRYFGLLSQIAWTEKQLQMTLVLGEAPLVGVDRVWVNGTGIDIVAGHRSSVYLSSDQIFQDEGMDTALRLDFYLDGTVADISNMIDAPFDSAEGLLWETGMRMEGLAFCVVYATQDDAGEWWRGVPQIAFRSTGYTWAPPGETAKVITNAAEVRRWWEMEREREPLSRVDAAAYTSAVAICAAASYEIHGTVSSTDDLDSLREAFDFAWDGTVVDFNGSLRFYPGTARTQILTIPADDLVELPVIHPVRDLHERVNSVDIRLQQSRAIAHAEFSLPTTHDTIAQTRDGGVLAIDLGSIEYVTDPVLAQYFAVRYMEEVRGLTAEVTVPYGTDAHPYLYLGLAPGTILGVDLPGLRDKRFRLDSTGPGEEDTLHFLLTEETDTRYTAVVPRGSTPSLPPNPVPPTGTGAGPTGLFATASTINSSVSIAWDPFTGAVGYQYRRRIGTGTWTVVDVGTPTIAHFTETMVGTRYEFQVRAVLATGFSSWSSSVYITALALGSIVLPAVPTGVFATASMINSSISVAWDPVDGATSYQVASSIPGVASRVDTGSATIFHFTTAQFPILTVGVRYEFRVRATNSAGSSAWSARIFATVLAPIAVPLVPAGLFATASTVNAGDVSIAWAATAGATSYQYRRRIGTGSWTIVDRGARTIAHYAGTVGVRYEFQVRATNGAGSSTWSSSVYITALAASGRPTVPTGLFATASTTNSSVSIAWNAVTGATSYQYRRRIGTGSWSQGDTGTTRAYHYTGTTVGTRYEFQVRATNAVGPSAWSSSVYATALAASG